MDSIGLDIILWFQNNRTGWMELYAKIFDALGYDLGYIAILGLIFWAFNKREGLRMVFALVIIVILTNAVKDLLMSPRPFITYPDLVFPVVDVEGYSMPSGHTTFAVMIWGYIALWIRKSWVWVFAISYMILSGLARIVAGVHYPQEVIAGAILGAFTLAIYYPLTERWEQFWKTQSLTVQLVLATGIPLVLSVVIMALPLTMEQIEAYLSMTGLAGGIGIGVIVESRFIQFEPHQQLARRAIHFVIAGVLVVAVLLGLSPLFDMIAETGVLAYLLRVIRYGFAGFTAIAIVTWLGTQTGLMHSPQKTESLEAPV